MWSTVCKGNGVHLLMKANETVAVGVCDSCAVTVSKLICSDNQWLLHFTQSTWPSHLHTLPPHGQRVEVQLSAVAVLKEQVGGGGGVAEQGLIMCKTKKN